jgi:signal transduction histidine kinase
MRSDLQRQDVLERQQVVLRLPELARALLRTTPVWLVVVQTLTAAGGSGPGYWVTAVALLLLLAGAWAFLLYGPGPAAADQAAMVLAVGAAGGLHAMTNAGQVFVVGYSVLYVAPFFYSLPLCLPASISAVLSIGLEVAFVGTRDITGGLGNAVGAFFFGVASLSWGRVMRDAKRNAELVEELRASRAAEQRGAAAAERARLARELHDVLAHTLSGLALQLESTRALARSRGIDPEVTGRIAAAGALARTGLDEARAAVGTLRDDDLPGPERIGPLVERFAATSGLDCRLVVTGEPRPLEPAARVALFRAVQEALSNVAKHSAATRVEVVLDWRDGEVTLRVDDTAPAAVPGVGSSGRAPGDPAGATDGATGNGLRGMRERAELVGGRVQAGPTGSGFRLEMSLPA